MFLNYTTIHKRLDADMHDYHDSAYKDAQNKKFCYLTEAILLMNLYDDELSLYYGRILYNALLDMHTLNWYDKTGPEYADTIIIHHLLDEHGLIEWGTSIRTPWLLTHKNLNLINNLNGFTLKLTDDNVKALLTWINPEMTRLPYKSIDELENEELEED